MQFKHFKYTKSYRIPYRGCYFHSLLELKYAIFLEQDFRYLREPDIIGYDPNTLQTSSYFTENIKLYSPDFLIRSMITGKASVVEIKPDQLKCSAECDIYYKIAEHYIERTGMDADFRIVSEKDFELTGEGLRRYTVFEKNKAQFQKINAFRELDRQYNTNAMHYSKSIPSFPNDELSMHEYARFVRRGTLASAA